MFFIRNLVLKLDKRVPKLQRDFLRGRHTIASIVKVVAGKVTSGANRIGRGTSSWVLAHPRSLS